MTITRGAGPPGPDIPDDFAGLSFEDLLKNLVEKHQARDATARGTALAVTPADHPEAAAHRSLAQKGEGCQAAPAWVSLR